MINKGVAYTGIPSEEELRTCPGVPSIERMKKGRVACIECVQEIPCNPCESSCKFGAIAVGSCITNLPNLDEEKCVGCKACMQIGCPAISIHDGKAKIDTTQCVGCGVCQQLCRLGALKSGEEA